MLGFIVVRAIKARHTPGAPIRCPACGALTLVETAAARFTCRGCRASYTRAGMQLRHNEDHVPTARLR